MSSSTPPAFPQTPELHDALRPITILWGTCCFSPLLYLTCTWLLRRWGMTDGLFPLSKDAWLWALIGLSLLAILLQIAHILVRLRYKPLLNQARQQSIDEFAKVLMRRTMLLMLFSETPVFLAFGLYFIQGRVEPVFGFGLVSMLLYAQSHPKSMNPVLSSQTKL